MTPATAPVYLDWTFWAFVVAALALVLSQLPPIKLMLRRARLRVDVYSTLGLTVHLGNANAQLHVVLINRGGTPLRVSGITLIFRRGQQTFELPARGYFAQTTDTQAVLLAPFTIKPDEEWGHILNCFMPFEPATLRRSKALTAPLWDDLRTRRAALPPNAPDVSLDENLIRPLVQFFNEQFRLEPDEYHLTVRVNWDRGKTDQRFRFTLFESDSQELRNFTQDYSFGYGLILRTRREMVFVPLEPVD
jgi:hypothetical protein